MNKHLAARRLSTGLALAASLAGLPAFASDHLDTPTVLADPAADIGDLYAWTSADGHRLNLVLDIVGRRFSDQVQYVMQVDSGPSFGHTTASTRIACQFEVDGVATCWAGTQDSLHGSLASPRGLDSRDRGSSATHQGMPRRSDLEIAFLGVRCRRVPDGHVDSGQMVGASRRRALKRNDAPRHADWCGESGRCAKRGHQEQRDTSRQM